MAPPIDGRSQHGLTYDLRMRRLAVWIVLVACSAPARTPHSPADWSSSCGARIEAARKTLALGGATKIDATPWNPSVRFEVHVGDGYYEASVQHGRNPCIDFDSDEPSFTNLKWSDGASATKVAVDRIRRMDGDEAMMQADKVPRETAERFRSAFEGALESCLQDARGVKLGPVSSDVSCMDKMDKCPDSPTAASAEDGCPDH